jgi:hypothetical protein
MLDFDDHLLLVASDTALLVLAMRCLEEVAKESLSFRRVN